MSKLSIKKGAIIFFMTTVSLQMVGCTDKVVEVNEQQVESSIEDDNKVIEARLDDNNEVNTTTVSNNNLQLQQPENNFNDEQDIIDYFDNMTNDTNKLLNKENFNKIEDVESKIESNAMTFALFLSGDATIGGYTINDVSDETKIYLKEKYIELDNMIETKWPNYKDNIKEKSKEFKEYCKESYQIIKDQVIEWKEEGTASCAAVWEC